MICSFANHPLTTHYFDEVYIFRWFEICYMLVSQKNEKKIKKTILKKKLINNSINLSNFSALSNAQCAYSEIR